MPIHASFHLFVSGGHAVAVRAVKAFSDPITNGLHDLLLVSVTVSNIVWNDVPFRNCSRRDLFSHKQVMENTPNQLRLKTANSARTSDLQEEYGRWIYWLFLPDLSFRLPPDVMCVVCGVLGPPP